MIIEVHVPGQENEQSWTYLGVFILYLFCLFLRFFSYIFVTVSIVWYFLFSFCE